MSSVKIQIYIKNINPNNEKRKSLEKTQSNKCQQLYENYKIKKTKEENYRQKILSEREKNELAECSFSPKITKSKNIFKKQPFEPITKEDKINNKLKTKELLSPDSSTINLIDRQNKWLENRNNKLNHKIVKEALKSVEGCVFKPEIKKINQNLISNFKIEANKIVEKPYSYINYIKRNKKIIENKNNNRKNEYPIARNWKSPNRSRILKNNDYDYTKHELTDNNYLLKNKSTSNYNINFNTNLSNNKSFKNKDIKTIKSIPISKLKITNISNNELYSIIYISEKEKIEKNLEDYTEENLEKIFKGKKQIYFKQAMDVLHNSLIDLNISDEDSDYDMYIKGNVNENENQISC